MDRPGRARIEVANVSTLCPVSSNNRGDEPRVTPSVSSRQRLNRPTAGAHRVENDPRSEAPRELPDSVPRNANGNGSGNGSGQKGPEGCDGVARCEGAAEFSAGVVSNVCIRLPDNG